MPSSTPRSVVPHFRRIETIPRHPRPRGQSGHTRQVGVRAQCVLYSTCTPFRGPATSRAGGSWSGRRASLPKLHEWGFGRFDARNLLVFRSPPPSEDVARGSARKAAHEWRLEASCVSITPQHGHAPGGHRIVPCHRLRAHQTPCCIHNPEHQWNQWVHICLVHLSRLAPACAKATTHMQSAADPGTKTKKGIVPPCWNGGHSH
jgi:hypothetical protein